MTMEYIRETYGVPAKVGGRVLYTGGQTPEQGTIKAAKNARLMVQLDSKERPLPFHPTWKLEYL